MNRAWYFLVALSVLSLDGIAQSLVAESATERAQFVELFSSEGCSSCPPADRWISKLEADPGLWKKIVPLAWHVTYWNRLGWTDSFSKEEMTDRQVRITKLWDRGSVYTPGVVLNGQEWNWRSEPLPAPTQIADWNIKIYKVSDDHYLAKVLPIKKDTLKKTYFLHYAVLGFGLRSKVTTGENSGEVLVHNFLVLDHGQMQIKNDKYEIDVGGAHKDASKLALVTWIEEKNRPISLQSVGLYLYH